MNAKLNNSPYPFYLHLKLYTFFQAEEIAFPFNSQNTRVISKNYFENCIFLSFSTIYFPRRRFLRTKSYFFPLPIEDV